VTKISGIVSAVICFCHSGNLPNYHGRYQAENNHRIDYLSLKLDRAFRTNIRPSIINVNHKVPSLDTFWQFKNAGLKNLQINGHLSLVSPGDVRMQKDEGEKYAILRHQIEVKKLLKMKNKYSVQLEQDGFSSREFDELLDLKQKRLEYVEKNPSKVKGMMEVFSQPLSIIRGNRT